MSSNPKLIPGLGFPLISFLLVSIFTVNPVEANWLQDRGTSGSNNMASGGSELVPPLSLYGEHEFSLVGLLPGLIANQQMYVVFGDARVVAFERNTDHTSDAPFTSGETLWTYHPMDDRDLEEEGLPSIASDVLLLSNMVVVPKVVMDVSTNTPSVHLVGLDFGTGEEEWRYKVEDADRPQLRRSSTGILFLSFMDTSEDPMGIPTLQRISSGDLSPNRTISAGNGLPVVNNPNGVSIDSVRLVVEDGQDVIGLDQSSLIVRWVHSETSEHHGDAAGESRRDLILADNITYVALGEGHFYSLGFNGSLRWANTLELPDGCDGNIHLSMSPHGVVASGVCDNLVVLLDKDTGEEIWRVETPTLQPLPPAVHENHVYLPSFETGIPEIIVVNLEEGELVERFDTGSPGPAFMSLAMVDGHLVGARGGLGTGYLSVMEQEPAAVTTTIEGGSQFPCGSFVNTEMEYLLHIENQGPGSTRDGEIVLNTSSPADFTATAPSGVEVQSLSSSLRLDIGDMEASAEIPVIITVAPRSAGFFSMETEVNMPVRNAVSGGGVHGTGLEVFPAPDPEVSVGISHVEVTQGIQDFDQSVPLVAQKTTLIRVYTEADEDVGPVQAEVLLTGNISGPGFSRSYTNEPAIPISECLDIQQDPSNFRSDLGTSFNFLIPPEMMEGQPDGSWEIEVVLDPEFLLPIADRSEFTRTKTINFESVPPLCIISRPILTEDDDGEEMTAPNRFTFFDIDRARTLVPVHEIMTFPRSGTLSRGNSLVGPRPYSFDPDSTYDTHRLLGSLRALNILSSRPDECKNAGALTLQYGLAHEDTRFLGRLGVALRGKSVGAVLLGIPDRNAEFNNPMTGMVLAHEIAHNLDRRHVDCGNPENVDEDFPYDTCQIGPISSSAFFGVDLFRSTEPVIIDPGINVSGPDPADILSYGSAVWTSDYTWNAMMDELIDHKEANKAAEQTPEYLAGPGAMVTAWMDPWRGKSGREIFFTAIIDPEGDGEIDTILPLGIETMGESARVELAGYTQSALGKDTGFVVELLDEQGDVILEVPLDLDAVDDTAVPDDHLAEALLPEPDGLAALRFVNQNKGLTLDSVERSENAPEVELLEPQGGNVVEEELVVHWEASDPDGNPLTTVVQYSHDNGETWSALTNAADIPPVVFDASLLPGGVDSAMIRLVVNDGFNSTEVESDLFTVVPRDPLAMIARPGDGEIFQEGEPIFFTSDSYDPEDGPLRGDALLWNVEGIGEVGTGRTILLTDLRRGDHRITLEATDSDGNTATDEIDIHILPPQATLRDIVRVILGHEPFQEGIGLDRNLDDVLDAADVVENSEGE